MNRVGTCSIPRHRQRAVLALICFAAACATTPGPAAQSQARVAATDASSPAESAVVASLRDSLGTIRHLITHTSGLPAFKAYDRQTHDPDSLAKLMFSTPLDTLPGVRMIYSDIGAYMLGRLVERLSGETLDQYVLNHVFQPLAM